MFNFSCLIINLVSNICKERKKWMRMGRSRWKTIFSCVWPQYVIFLTQQKYKRKNNHFLYLRHVNQDELLFTDTSTTVLPKNHKIKKSIDLHRLLIIGLNMNIYWIIQKNLFLDEWMKKEKFKKNWKKTITCTFYDFCACQCVS